ncbi:hypothetical protein MM213_16455 [Belliella sp. R4-6]|uniref:DUF5673 domain-containing protein n=1 Tax=Belliella alkalica TaxID=1730871 RepID=A0ABS9VGF1_9BACT|nr:hypothetical protein [Belliella alkalica]MCH7415095.1 hypothetical protein [Belliella alkalica]
MKIYDKYSYKVLIFFSALQVVFGLIGLFTDYPKFTAFPQIIIGLAGIAAGLYSIKIPYVEIVGKTIIKHSLFKKKMDMDEVQTIEKIDNVLILKSEKSKIKLRRTMLDTLEVRKFEDFIKNEISGREV